MFNITRKPEEVWNWKSVPGLMSAPYGTLSYKLAKMQGKTRGQRAKSFGRGELVGNTIENVAAGAAAATTPGFFRMGKSAWRKHGFKVGKAASELRHGQFRAAGITALHARPLRLVSSIFHNPVLEKAYKRQFAAGWAGATLPLAYLSYKVMKQQQKSAKLPGRRAPDMSPVKGAVVGGGIGAYGLGGYGFGTGLQEFGKVAAYKGPYMRTQSFRSKLGLAVTKGQETHFGRALDLPRTLENVKGAAKFVGKRAVKFGLPGAAIGAVVGGIAAIHNNRRR